MTSFGNWVPLKLIIIQLINYKILPEADKLCDRTQLLINALPCSLIDELE
jgi:hypothetical protein